MISEEQERILFSNPEEVHIFRERNCYRGRIDHCWPLVVELNIKMIQASLVTQLEKSSGVFSSSFYKEGERITFF